MDYRRLFDRLKCHILVIFDDEFINDNPSKKQIVFDFVTMDLEDQNDLLSQMCERHLDAAETLKVLVEEINPIYSQIDWDGEVLRDDFESAFPVIKDKIGTEKARSIREKYDAINEKELINQHYWLSQYGLCVAIPSCYHQLIWEYQDNGGRHSKLRIYSDFTASTKAAFEQSLQQASEDRTVVCVIDNCLKDQYKAQEILDCISVIDENNANVIGTVFTSKETTERIDERLCFVCTNKAEVNRLSMNIVRSAYHYFLKQLQREISINIGEAFKKAKEYKYIANYLAQRAVREGISDYEVMQNWIRLLYEVQSSKSNAAKRLISLAQIVDELEDDEQDLVPAELSLLDDLNTWEIFDYRVNDYHLPPMPGDVFVTDANEVYILIGQDCDMMMAEGRKRRVAAAELLPVDKLVLMDKPEKISNDMEYVWIANYKHTDSQAYCMRVDYRHRKYIDGRILDLSAYDADGNCDFLPKIDRTVKDILQPHLVGHHEKLSAFFQAIRQLKDNCSDVLDEVLSNDQYLFLPSAYKQIEDGLHFPLRRVCRLKQTYVFFLYKLYLEYRGRQPFETINYAASLLQSIRVSHEGMTHDLDIAVRLGSHSFDAKIQKLPWIVKREKLCEALKKIGIDEKVANRDELIVLKDKKTEIELKNGGTVIITKEKDNKATVSFARK